MEAYRMNQSQKTEIAALRGKGASYTEVAAALSLSVNTVKSFCRRNAVGTAAQPIHIQKIETPDACAHCGRKLNHTPGAKKRRFCSDNCRMAWWKVHPEAMNRRAVYHFTCPICKKEFDCYGNSRRTYCSRLCFGKARRAVHG
jgi:endogenous inhibitor of DNA gyrase (YacG/DUF329 family)